VKLLLIFNPHAAMGRASRLLPGIRSSLARFAAVDIIQTRHAGHARDLAAESELGLYDGIIAAGGDGTLYEVLNGLYQKDQPDRRPLGLIPVGTGNAFARDLGLMPGDWEKGIGIIAKNSPRKVDVGRVHTHSEIFYFLNVIGLGFAVDAGLTAKKLKKLGNAAYSLGTLWETLKLKSYPLHIEIDGKNIKQDNVFVEISNSRYTGTSFLIAPEAQIDDGLLDITLLSSLPRRRLLRLFPTIYSGRHVRYKEVSTYQARKIRIHAPGGRMMAPDGEFHGATPADISCLHRDLEMFLPDTFNRAVGKQPDV
jgi:YegS/Rv2252/BmrU family lipid kinase